MNVLGMWVWPQNVKLRGARQVVESCSAVGVTDLYFLTKGLAGTTSFQGHHAPAFCERDLLRELLDVAHQRGLRVHAWFTSASDEHYKRLFPESGRCHLVRGRDKGLISLADEGYLRYMQGIVGEVCQNYEVDGLHLDYIRYNHLLYGWAEEDVRRYRAQGVDAQEIRRLLERTFLQDDRDENCIFNAYRSAHPSVLALARARRQDVVHFAQALTQAALAENSRLILSAALMPEGAYEDTAFSDLHYGQNYADAAALFHDALPMAYSHAYARDERWVAAVAQGTLKHGMRTIVGLHAYEGATGSSLKRDWQAAASTPAQGVCLFREGATALACTDGAEVCVHNTLDESITEVVCRNGAEQAVIKQTVAPGCWAAFRSPFPVQELSVFCAETEKCVFLSRNPPKHS